MYSSTPGLLLILLGISSCTVSAQECLYQYVEQPPSDIMCNPYTSNNDFILNCQVSFPATDNIRLEVLWFYNGQRITENSFSPPLTLIDSGISVRRLTSISRYNFTNSTSFAGNYSCQFVLDGNLNLTSPSNLFMLKEEVTYTAFPPCDISAQSVQITSCARNISIDSTPPPTRPPATPPLRPTNDGSSDSSTTSNMSSTDTTAESGDASMVLIIVGVAAVSVILAVTTVIIILCCCLCYKKRKAETQTKFIEETIEMKPNQVYGLSTARKQEITDTVEYEVISHATKEEALYENSLGENDQLEDTYEPVPVLQDYRVASQYSNPELEESDHYYY